jgi:hypothetical protein
MNWLILIAGVFAAFTTLGHFFVGSKNFLKPMLNADFDEVPKKVMHSVFHYVSTYLILSSLALLIIGLGFDVDGGISPLVRFIAVNYAIFAVWQVIIALSSKIPNALFKLFQWIFFVIIAVFAWLGA